MLLSGHDRKLVVNEPEAETVRYIFRRYHELRSVRLLKEHLEKAEQLICTYLVDLP